MLGVQYSVWLESVEQVAAEVRPAARANAAGFRKQHCEHHELTLHSLQTHFSFQIPAETTQEFATDIGTSITHMHTKEK